METRKTKIIATVGPATDSPEMIEKLICAGANCIRLNFSHGTHESHKRCVDIVQDIRKKLKKPVAIMLDTKGPEFRVCDFKEGKISLSKGDKFIITTRDVEGDQNQVSVNYKDLHNDLEPGDTILANDGLVVLEVEKIDGQDIHCVVKVGGKLSDHKSLNFPDKVVDVEYFSEKDKADVQFAIDNDLEYVACSFVSVAQNVLDVRQYLDEHGAENIGLIAKIENQSGIDNLEEICKICDAVMVARGDLGVEVDFDKLPACQKKIEGVCTVWSTPFITCTEMLESMIENPRPTRAESGDVANAVFDGTSAVMLSGETAAGKYPIEAVEAMSRICLASEKLDVYLSTHLERKNFDAGMISNAIAHAATSVARDIDAKGIIVFSDGGYVPKMISCYKSKVDTVTITPNIKTYNQLALAWGIQPVYMPGLESFDETYNTVAQIAKLYFNIQPGERVVSCSGYSFTGHSYLDNFVRIREF